MNQVSAIGFGPDSSVMSAYAQRANERLGTFDLVVENTGANTLRLQLRQFDGTTSPSGYANVGTAFVVVPGGVQTKTFNCLGTRIGFFGSGNTATNLGGTAASTKANVSVVIRNKSDLRGAQIDIVSTGRKGWGYDDAFAKGTLTKQWGSPPDSPSTPSVS